MSQNIEDINPTDWNNKLLNFEELYPSPTTEEIALLNETTSERESIQFVLNRICELNECLELYHRMLDEMVEKKQEKLSLELASEASDATTALHNGHLPTEPKNGLLSICST